MPDRPNKKHGLGKPAQRRSDRGGRNANFDGGAAPANPARSQASGPSASDQPSPGKPVSDKPVSGKLASGKQTSDQGALFEAAAQTFASAQNAAPATAATKDTAIGSQGHRQRLRQRFMSGGSAAMPDYELLELVLFRAIPRRDTKDLAKRLLARFGTFSEVINAPEARLKEVHQVGDAVVTELKLVRAAALRMMQIDILQKPVMSSWASVVAYCRSAMGFEDREQFRVLFLDKKNRLIADEVQQTGTVDHTPVYIREIMKRALELQATAIILAHNHPSGDPTPSRTDIEMTRQIVSVATPLNIAVHDHLIVGRDGHASFRDLGLL